MASLRTYLFDLLTSPDNTELFAKISGRVFAKKSMSSSVEQHPFLVYKLGNTSDEGLSESNDPSRQYFQIYIHDYRDDQVANYDLIDEILVILKAMLKDAVVPEYDIIRILYLETSQDLDDDTLNTVFRYVRFQAILGKAV